jgi:hypothetical protein
MAEHKHAAVLRAIAEGVPLSEFEVSRNEVCWAPLGEYQISNINNDILRIRRKPQYITINGFKVPKPLDVMPNGGYVYAPSFLIDEGVVEVDSQTSIARRALNNKGLHTTKEAAKAHYTAICGIDPNWRE